VSLAAKIRQEWRAVLPLIGIAVLFGCRDMGVVDPTNSRFFSDGSHDCPGPLMTFYQGQCRHALAFEKTSVNEIANDANQVRLSHPECASLANTRDCAYFSVVSPARLS
jgi:hypothetical protein